MTSHIFNNHCIDFAEILNETTIDAMLKVAHRQSTTELAKMRVDFAHYKDYGRDESCPAYFGMFVEWLAENFLDHYGRWWNIQSISMTDSIGASCEDYGVDGQGLSITRKVLRSTGRVVEANSPVYIQVKGTLNPKKLYSPNDGARLPNFGCNAFANAITSGRSYQARYLLFTTGEGIHYTMDNMFIGLVEVISRKDIAKHMNNDVVFLNKLRSRVGLPEVPVDLANIDHEASLIRLEIDRAEATS